MPLTPLTGCGWSCCRRSEMPEAEGQPQIRVSYDKDAGTITIADNGIGMSRAR